MFLFLIARLTYKFNFFLQTVDQLFKMNLPMDVTHLQALISVIFHSLDEYIHKISDQLGIAV